MAAATQRHTLVNNPSARKPKTCCSSCHLCHAQRFYVGTVGVKDDVFDVGDGDIVSVKFDVHFPLAVLEKKQVLVRDGTRPQRSENTELLESLPLVQRTAAALVYKPTAQPRGRAPALAARLPVRAERQAEDHNSETESHAIYTHSDVYSERLPSIRFPS